MKAIFEEFKQFAIKGNVVDMAVGVIIGGAFGKIVSSLVADVIMPVIGVLVGGVKFNDLRWVLREAAEGQVEVALAYGNFIQSVVDFTIIAAAIFFAIKALSKLKSKPQPQPQTAPPPPKELLVLEEIRDLLKQR